MSVEELRSEIERLEDIAWDDEAAHSLEDDLMRSVLKEVANGSSESVELAKLMLTSAEINFARWCT